MRALLAAAAVGAAGLLIGVLVRQRRRRERKTLPPAQIISLSRRPAKRASVLERAAAAGLEQVEIFDAVDGRELAAEGLSARGVRTYSGWKLEGSTDRFFSRALKWGEIGCALSHHGVWELARASKEDAMLVLEDDVDFLPGFVELLRASLDEVDALVADGLVAPPDLLYLTRRAMRPEHDQLLPRKGEPRLIRTASGDEVMGPPRLVVPGFSYKTTAYVLYRRGAAKLAESGYLSKVIPVDDFLSALFCKHEAKAGAARPDIDALFASVPRLNVLAVRPQLARERRGVSDTENSELLAGDAVE